LRADARKPTSPRTRGEVKAGGADDKQEGRHHAHFVLRTRLEFDGGAHRTA
jgi:hypothetical protein